MGRLTLGEAMTLYLVMKALRQLLHDSVENMLNIHEGFVPLVSMARIFDAALPERPRRSSSLLLSSDTCFDAESPEEEDDEEDSEDNSSDGMSLT